MRKAAIIALVAAGSSLAVYAGFNRSTASEQKSKTECCVDADCCLMGGNANCCDLGCE